jgi:hypothetical protein
MMILPAAATIFLPQVVTNPLRIFKNPVYPGRVNLPSLTRTAL